LVVLLQTKIINFLISFTSPRRGKRDKQYGSKKESKEGSKEGSQESFKKEASLVSL
jgi:hypothetical protein